MPFRADPRRSRRASWRGTLAAAALALTAPAALAQAQPAGALQGKRVLITPYWLDNFNTANTSWIARLLKPMGVETDVINPNAQSSKQLNTIETAISSQNYDEIVWAPVDATTAGTTIRKIQQARIPQLLNVSGAKPGMDGLQFAAISVDWTTVYVPAGEDAARYVKAHPNLGPARIAWVGDLPASQVCRERFSGLEKGVKTVIPDAEVVFNEGASSQEQARSKMTDFITRDIPFNIFAGCGGTVSLGGIAAINAAGLGGAVNKAPEHVYMMSLDGSPPELDLLWKGNVALMRAGLFGPKRAAQVAVKTIADQLTGKLPYDKASDASVDLIWLTPDCDKERPVAVEQFEGVQGFKVPECSFKYSE